jgi:hypothetical protein
MNRQRRRHAAKHHREPQVTGTLVVRDGRVTIAGPIPGLGAELMKGYYARQAQRYRVVRDAAAKAERDAQEQEEPRG